ncbi:MAG TPA: hypothetical protein VEJ41_06210 [Candidatus Acidoferrales bacterium]|nr:hypothetical protein [Candidatus Acidoferrales bacterium]
MSTVPRGAAMCFTMLFFASTGLGPEKSEWRARLPNGSPLRFALFAIFAGFALAAMLPPALAMPHFVALAAFARRAWGYWCSMLLGATPFLTMGALLSALLAGRGSRANGLWLAASSVCLPVCDCTIASYTGVLSRISPALASCTLTLGACCNPLALFVTWIALGPRLTWARAACGLAIALCTALAWRLIPGCSAMSRSSPEHAGLAERFACAIAQGYSAFALAAVAASLAIALHAARVIGHSAFAAAALGALMSPCSSADALLARALFTQPKCELAFVIAAQCLDVRQALVLVRAVGARRAFGALATSMVACTIACAFVR